MKKKDYKKRAYFIGSLLLFSIIGALVIGRYKISVMEVVEVLIKTLTGSSDVSKTSQDVVFNLRLPRVLGGVLIGSGLALSGSSYQSVFKNPLVAPDILGVTAGATVGAMIAILLRLSPVAVQLYSFVGGIIAVVLATILPKLMKNKGNMVLVLSGIIVSGFMNSIIGVLKYIADPEDQLSEIIYWQMGSLSKINMTDVMNILPIVLVSGTVLLLLSWRINILTLGDKEARMMGINVNGLKSIVIVCSTLLTASAVSISGAIGWIGIVVPHLSRLIVGADGRRAFPVSAMIGAIFLVFIDTMARVVTSGEIPLSILTGIIGAPLYFFILIRQKGLAE